MKSLDAFNLRNEYKYINELKNDGDNKKGKEKGDRDAFGWFVLGMVFALIIIVVTYLIIAWLNRYARGADTSAPIEPTPIVFPGYYMLKWKNGKEYKIGLSRDGSYSCLYEGNMWSGSWQYTKAVGAGKDCAGHLIVNEAFGEISIRWTVKVHAFKGKTFIGRYDSDEEFTLTMIGRK